MYKQYSLFNITLNLLQKKRMTGENYEENKKAQRPNSNIVMNK